MRFNLPSGDYRLIAAEEDADVIYDYVMAVHGLLQLLLERGSGAGAIRGAGLTVAKNDAVKVGGIVILLCVS